MGEGRLGSSMAAPPAAGCIVAMAIVVSSVNFRKAGPGSPQLQKLKTAVVVVQLCCGGRQPAAVLLLMLVLQSRQAGCTPR